MQVAIVKAGPHKIPWLSYESSMNDDMPEGALVVILRLSDRNDALVSCSNDVYPYGSWYVHIDSLEIIGDL